MAMTKAERAAMQALRERAALNWPTWEPEPVDVKAWQDATGETILRLWTFAAYRGEGRVSLGWTDGHVHSSSGEPHPSGETWRGRASQTSGGPWYHTKRDALIALRAEATRQAAAKLAVIDQWIEDEGASHD